MKRILAVLAVLAVIGLVVGVGAVQYVAQVPAKKAIIEYLTQRHINAPPMGETALGFRGGPPPTSFGPVGPIADPGPACYDSGDRPLPHEDALDPSLSGAGCGATVRHVPVAGSGGLGLALAKAQAGDSIDLAPGDYDFAGQGITLGGSGSASLPIIVRTAHLGDARIHLTTVEGFSVNKPYWIFENLVITGNCPQDNDCEHAFHVTGPARGTIIRNNRIKNFNAAIKINRDQGGVADDILIERNLIFNDRPRETQHPVTLIDAVAVDRLHLVANVIADFAKNGGDHVSYAAFAKGGGTGALFERNLVMCEWRHRGGNRVGLSMGGGGTIDSLCREGHCPFEQQGGIVRNNIIANCSDAGVYLRHAPGSRVENNLLYATRGIEGRFGDTSAQVVNNIVDGRLIGWNGAALSESSNVKSRLRAAFLRRESETVLRDPRRGDMRFASAGDVSRRGAATDGEQERDFCGTRYDPRKPPVGPIEQEGKNCAASVAGLH